MSQGIQSVSADHMESPIHYKYMTEGELTDEEKILAGRGPSTTG